MNEVRRPTPVDARDAFVVAFFVVQYGLLARWVDPNATQFVYAGFYASAAALLGLRAIRRRHVGRPTAALAWPLAYAALAVLSVAWSDLPDLTLRRSLALAGAMTFAVWLATVWDGRRLFRAVAWALTAIGLVSALLVFAAPDLGVHGAASQHAGDWRGALLHKNLLGREMAFGAALAVTFAFASAGVARWGWWAAGGLMAGLVLQSGSATGWALAAALAAVVLVGRVPAVNARERLGRATLAVSGALVALGALASAAPLVLAAVGRDATFTGRDRIWELTLERVIAAPLGHGYGAFWDGPPGAAIARSLGYAVGHAHNGWLESAAQLGWLGLALTVALTVAVGWNVLRDRRGLHDPARAGVALLVVYALVVNLPDAVTTGPNSPTLTLLVVAWLVQARRPDAVRVP